MRLMLNPHQTNLKTISRYGCFVWSGFLVLVLYLALISIAHAQAADCTALEADAKTAVQAYADAQKALATAQSDLASDTSGDPDGTYQQAVDDATAKVTSTESTMTAALNAANAGGCATPAPGDDPGCTVSVTVGTETASFCFFNQFDNAAKTTSSGWLKKIRDLGRNTFFILATLEFIWAAAIWVIEKDDMNSLMSEMIKKIMFISFFYALLDHAPDWIPRIIATFGEVGTQAVNSSSGITDKSPVTVDKIIATGFAIVKFIWKPVASMDVFAILGAIGKIFVAILVTVIVVIAYFIAAVQLLCLNIESYILLAAGVILLALGGSSWTKEYVDKYLSYAMGVGVRLLALLLILGLTQTFVTKIGETFIFEYQELFHVLAMAVMTMLLAVQAPEMGGALMNGLASGFSAGAMKSAAQSVTQGVKTVGGAAAGVAGAGVAAGKGAYHLGKLAQNSSKLAGMTGGSASKAFIGTLAKEGGRSLMNAARGQDGSKGFKAGGKQDPKDKKNPMGTGSSKKPGAIDRANREVKAQIEAVKKKGGGGIEGGG